MLKQSKTVSHNYGRIVGSTRKQYIYVSVLISCCLAGPILANSSNTSDKYEQSNTGMNSSVNDPISKPDGKLLLQKYCSQCHGIPSAKKQKAGRWKNVILRMQRHRQKRGFKPLSESDIFQLSQYLNLN